MYIYIYIYTYVYIHIYIYIYIYTQICLCGSGAQTATPIVRLIASRPSAPTLVVKIDPPSAQKSSFVSSTLRTPLGSRAMFVC